MADAPSSRRLAHSLIGAPQRGHSPASIVRKPVVRNGAASIARVPHIQTVYIRRKGSPVSRRAFSVCARTSETEPRRHSGDAERGLRPQGAQRRRGGTPPRASSACRSCGTVPRAGTGAPSVRTSARSPAPHSPASIVRVPDSRPAARASASTLEPLAMNFFSPGNRAVPANATGDGA